MTVESILNRAYSSSVTKERQNSIWREITAIVHNTQRNRKRPRNKWEKMENFISAARVAIRN
jgi:hypothetical protein